MNIAVLGTREPEATLARTEPGQMGNPPFSAWHAEHQGVALGTFADAAATAELVVDASSGAATLDVIDLGGIETARGTEMLLPIWLLLMGTLGTVQFNFKVVR